jgi:hypothetical protein
MKEEMDSMVFPEETEIRAQMETPALVELLDIEVLPEILGIEVLQDFVVQLVQEEKQDILDLSESRGNRVQ